MINHLQRDLTCCNTQSHFNKFVLLCIVVTIVVFSLESGAQTIEFDADNAFFYLEKQCLFGTREPGSEGAQNCLHWFEELFKEFGAEVYLQRFEAVEALTGKERKLTNIIAHFPREDESTLMLCAHWDTRAYANLDPDAANREKPILGANDGASGVAVLLEIARIASVNPPPMGLLIVLFDGEDMGRASYAEEFALGSKFWALHQIPVEVDEAILLDMIGDDDLEIPIEGFSERNAPFLRKQLWDIAHRLDLTAFSDDYGGGIADDHVRLQRAGIPAVDLIDFDYPYWHTLEDTPDKCSVESLDQVGKVLIGYIYGIE
ncbi:M28 family peptidase [bacterium]|nr:M28 family peptidase [bacterium]